jgi:acylglycerol lipase
MAARPRRRASGLIVALAAGLAALTGCAGREAASVPSAAAEETIRGAQTDLPLARWSPDVPAAVVVAIHGYGDHAVSTYEKAAEFWVSRGIEVFAYDQRGFGRNPSNRQWPGDEALVADLEAATREVRALRPGLPLFVVGHSMGGGVALAAAGEGRLSEAEGLVLLAPAVWGGDQLNMLLRASAWTAATLAPDMRWENGSVVTIRPTDNIELLRTLAGDPLRFANPSGREFLGLIRITDRAVAAAPEDRLPTLVVMGAHDEVIPEDAVRAAYEALPGPKEFAYVDTGWHMLLRDLQAERVWDLTAEWILRHASQEEAKAR